MSKRNFSERKATILRLLQQQGQASIEELTRILPVSQVTIRKDLTKLESEGYLIRRFGGAVLPHHEFTQPLNQTNDKAAIAAAAASLISDHSRIVIDCGLTTAQLAPLLHSKKGLVVMTNSLAVAQPLTEFSSSPTVLMPGGTWDKKTQSFQGQLSETLLRAYDFDQLFVGADGIDLQTGTTTFNELINLSRVMAEVSKQVIVLAESSKIGRKIPNQELAWSQIHCLVTDDRIKTSDKKSIEERGVIVKTVSKGQ